MHLLLLPDVLHGHGWDELYTYDEASGDIEQINVLPHGEFAQWCADNGIQLSPVKDHWWMHEVRLDDASNEAFFAKMRWM